MKKVLVFAMAAMMLAGCTKKVENVVVAGQWSIKQVQDLMLAGTEEMPLPLLNLIEGGEYHLYCGCNQINGRYSVEGDQITFTDGASTKMFCPDVAEMEDMLTSLLQGTFTAVVAEEDNMTSLTLTDADGVTVLRVLK